MLVFTPLEPDHYDSSFGEDSDDDFDLSSPISHKPDRNSLCVGQCIGIDGQASSPMQPPAPLRSKPPQQQLDEIRHVQERDEEFSTSIQRNEDEFEGIFEMEL